MSGWEERYLGIRSISRRMAVMVKEQMLVGPACLRFYSLLSDCRSRQALTKGVFGAKSDYLSRGNFF